MWFVGTARPFIFKIGPVKGLISYDSLSSRGTQAEVKGLISLDDLTNRGKGVNII